MSNTFQLAIHGGRPVRSAPMPARFAVGPAEHAMIEEALNYYKDRGVDFGYQGPFEERYNNLFADFMGGGYADAVATGTIALFVALAALQLPKGSQVLVSPITDPGSISAIIYNGLIPKIVDSKPDSYNIGVKQFVERLTPECSAIMVVHAAGQSTEIDDIVEEAHHRGIKVLEDCSQAHGALYKGQRVGTFGDIAAFSTMYRKASITGACGGVVYTRNEELFHLCLAYADRGKPRWKENFEDRNPTTFLFPALNLHTDELSCAIGIASLKRLPETIQRRLDFVAEVSERVAQQLGVCRPYGYRQGDSPFIYPIIVNADNVSCSIREFAEAVLHEGIPLNSHYMYVVHEWPWVKDYLADNFDCPNAYSIRNCSFNLYLNECYTHKEAVDTADAIKKVADFFTTR